MGNEGDWWLEIEWTGPSNDLSQERQPEPPKAPCRRSRGRPRKPNPSRFELPPRLAEAMRRAGPGNLMREEQLQESKRLCEEYRRDMVSKAVRTAFREGRNTANIHRKTVANQRKLRIVEENKALIVDRSLSNSAVADRIIRQGKSRGLGERTLWDIIALTRKIWRIKNVARKGVRRAK